MISWVNFNVVIASAKGYYVDDNGEVVSPKGTIRKCRICNRGYKIFNIKINKRSVAVYVHKLCAFKKYGYDSFCCECIRHLDGNKLNNSPSNILIGSFKDNQMDIPKEERLSRCDSIRKWNKKDIRDFYKRTKSYKLTMQKFGITSKGSLWFVLNK